MLREVSSSTSSIKKLSIVHKSQSLFLSLLFCLLFSACGPEIIFEKKLELPESGWTYADTLHYTFEIADTAQLYNLFFQIEHSTDYSSQNLYVKIHTGFPSGQRTAQVLSIDIADKMGQWLGTCSGESCALNVPIQSNAYFNQLGTHSFTIEQYMRVDPLPEVLSGRFRIEVAEARRN